MRNRLAILVIASLIPLALAMAAFLFLSLRSERDKTQASVAMTTASLAAAVEREFAANFELLNALAQSPILDGAPPDYGQFHDLATRFRSQVPLWFRIILSDAKTGSMLVNTGVPYGTVLGKVVDTEGQSLAIAEKRGIVGNLIGPAGETSAGVPRISLKVPVLRDAAVRYVLTATISMDRSASILMPPDLSRDYRPFLIDRTGTLAVVPRDSTRVGLKAAPNELSARNDAEAGAYWSVDSEYTAFHRIGSSGWSLHVAVPEASYSLPLVRTAWLLGAVGAVALALSAMCTLLLRREFKEAQRRDKVHEHTSRVAALGRITGGVAHDFNNILMVIAGSAEMLQKGVPPEARKYVERIKQASDRGARITRTLLDFSRQGAFHPEVVEVSAAISRLIPILQQAAGEKVRIEPNVAGDLWAWADPTQMEMALLNLVANARDAMPDGGRIGLSVRRSILPETSKGAVLVEVSDEGAGIPDEILPDVFQPFFTTKEVGHGTGLGLSQVYGFTRSVSGTARLSNGAHGGAVASMYLPEAAAPAERSAARSAAGRASALTEAAPGNRILVVDDDEDVRAVTEDFFRSAQWRVSVASDGQAALAVLEREAMDLVISDVVMPGGMNGLALGLEIRRRWPATEVILVSGFSDQTGEAIKAGFIVLAKPFTPQQIAEAITRLMP